MQVSAYPPFPGTEANFLRAQLARIAASTVLCPAGYFTANEEGGLDKAEDFTPAAPTDLGTAGAWAHRYPHLKKQGGLLLVHPLFHLQLCLHIANFCGTHHHCHHASLALLLVCYSGDVL